MMAFEWGCIRRIVLICCGLVLAGSFSGCAFGPIVLQKTHGRYQESIRKIDEEALLRNIVHLRYSEIPIELTVSSINAQYELDGSAEARPFFLAPNPSSKNVFRTFTNILPDLMVEGANRPTITFVPGDNSDTIKRFLSPLPTETLAPSERVELAGCGYPAAVGRTAQRSAQRRDSERPGSGIHLGL